MITSQTNKHFTSLKKSVLSISSKLAYRKSQRNFLEVVRNNDLCTSLRPKVGKVYKYTDLEHLKDTCLEECRLKLLDISITEAENDIGLLKGQYITLFNTCQDNISKAQYISLTNLAKLTEKKILMSQKKKHENKLIFSGNNINNNSDDNQLRNYHPEKTIRHKETSRLKQVRRNCRRRNKNKLICNSNLTKKVDSILKDGLVVNLTDIIIPDGAILFLSKGNSFVPATPVSKHDIIFDTNEFLRKLHWRTFFHTVVNDGSNGNNSNITKETHPKLRVPSHQWPNINNKILDSVCEKVKNLVNSLDTKKLTKYKNLSYLERQGLFWCIKMKATNKIHFSQADKGCTNGS